MISYKVLITLTVIFIINCGGEPGGLTSEDNLDYKYNQGRGCEDSLAIAGFSRYKGFLNYCFAKQFVDIQHFENHLNQKSEEASKNFPSIKINNDIAKKFFEDRRSYPGVQLNDPAKFCNEHMKTKQKTTKQKTTKCVFGCFTKNVEFDEKDCVEKITWTDDGKYKTSEYELNEIVKMKEYYFDVLVNIEYGNNEFKNAIKSYNLSLGVSPSDIIQITGEWNEYKRKYYEYQMKNFNEKENSGMFLNITQWCYEKKKAQK